MPNRISESLQAFLQQRLASIEQIEIVLLLMREPSRFWIAPEVSSALGMPPEAAAMRLFLLASSGVIALDATGVPRYRYSAADADTDALLRELATVYEEDRAAVATVIGVPPDPIRSFADAFKLKK